MYRVGQDNSLSLFLGLVRHSSEVHFDFMEHKAEVVWNGKPKLLVVCLAICASTLFAGITIPFPTFLPWLQHTQKRKAIDRNLLPSEIQNDFMSAVSLVVLSRIIFECIFDAFWILQHFVFPHVSK